ncbi:hypothetical protein BCR36DRAFT_586527 [Piromyces finnis]|uniref:Uncharacterized protein n=1 Tax=Piromyces finnis TaxID=1754191 RepID=A0A1Y1UYJ4_9FUNG|nr:hypothetical protein BCR36DRAFT_586527 [Piromyces finnis]|eukprot:ORX43585.1 hypothetical protein BCR36DRAFT_586527 [Piromyces finnis]
MRQLFHNFDGFFNNNTIQQPQVEKMKIPETKTTYSFSLFGIKKQNTEIKTAPVLKTESKNSKDKTYYPHSGMGLFFV